MRSILSDSRCFQASRAVAKLHSEFKAMYQVHINALPAEEQIGFYGMGSRGFCADKLPFVVGTEKGSAVVRLTSLAQGES